MKVFFSVVGLCCGDVILVVIVVFFMKVLCIVFILSYIKYNVFSILKIKNVVVDCISKIEILNIDNVLCK